ncbi:acyltransferase [Hymenobacter sp. BT188]|uniref:acyltransferase family protein n=1 Tax=Hymenobacter sp. BT188 TaxID=2763504 RepID=UPI0016518632|nr:acyltransferase [Hymenobacter sp. BT188]MBC6608753.1 acyltransferase [Hymenobacter sp. BT188]
MKLSLLTKPLRLYEIDLLRFLAALSVVVFHYTYRGYAADHYSSLPFLELGRYTRYGYLGVELFFIISVYVVLLSAKGKTVRQFFVSRLVRLYPAFWVACTLTFLVKRLWGTTPGDAYMPAVLHAGFGQYLCNMTMLEEFLGIAPLDGAYWSLTVEIAFYFLVSLLLSYRLMRYVEWFVAGWLLYAILLVLPHANTPFAALFFPSYAPYFAAGIIFYRRQQVPDRALTHYTLLAFAYLAAIHSSLRKATEMGQHYHDEFVAWVIVAIITLFFAVFFFITTRHINLSHYSWLAGLGALTYPLYLIHSDIGFVTFHRLAGAINKYVLVGSTLLVMLVIAHLIHVLAEKRFSRVFRVWVNKCLPAP